MPAIRRTLVLALMTALLATLFAPSAYAAGATVKATEHPTLGTILTDADGRTLYRFTRDTINTSSACYDNCAVTWPPLLAGDENPVAGEGIDGNLLGVLERTDGTRQVMYNGMPLYYYNQDAQPGDANGQRRGDVWFVVHPNTAPAGSEAVTVRTREHAELGTFLTDAEGRTLYLFTRDTDGQSVCYDSCASTWPPLLAGAGEPQLAEGIGGALGTTLRDDGERQVTYEGKPLYYFAGDTNAGDTNGQGRGDVWFVVAPVSAPAAAPEASAPPAAPEASVPPAELPRTGGEAAGWGLMLLAVALLALGGLLNGAGRRLQRKQ